MKDIENAGTDNSLSSDSNKRMLGQKKKRRPEMIEVCSQRRLEQEKKRRPENSF